MPTYDVFVTRHETDRVRYRVDADDREAAIKAAEEQYETGDPGSSIETIEGYLDWSTVDVAE